MEKIIQIGSKDIKLSNSIAWCMEYRDQFGKDPVQDHIPLLASIAEALATVTSDIGRTDNITLVDILSALEGRTIDLMIPLMQTELMTTIINVTWAMAKAADGNIDPPKQWARQFEEFPLDIVAPAIYELAFKGFVSSKNLTRLTNLKNTITKTSQPSASMTLFSQGSKEE